MSYRAEAQPLLWSKYISFILQKTMWLYHDSTEPGAVATVHFTDIFSSHFGPLSNKCPLVRHLHIYTHIFCKSYWQENTLISDSGIGALKQDLS